MEALHKAERDANFVYARGESLGCLYSALIGLPQIFGPWSFSFFDRNTPYVVPVAMQCSDIDKTFVILTSYFKAMIISPLGFCSLSYIQQAFRTNTCTFPRIEVT